MCDYDGMCVREGEYMSENECLVCDGMCEIVCDVCMHLGMMEE